MRNYDLSYVCKNYFKNVIKVTISLVAIQAVSQANTILLQNRKAKIVQGIV